MTENLFEPVRLTGQEFFDRLVALGRIAWVAGKCQVARSVGALRRKTISRVARADVLDLERDVRCAALSALSAPFFEQILTQFVTCKRTLLVFLRGDLGVLKFLQIEPDSLYFNRADWRKPGVTLLP